MNKVDLSSNTEYYWKSNTEYYILIILFLGAIQTWLKNLTEFR